VNISAELCPEFALLDVQVIATVRQWKGN
jgi:hypothetical protein